MSDSIKSTILKSSDSNIIKKQGHRGGAPYAEGRRSAKGGGRDHHH
ncbi:MAG: hypothetical protein M0C28_22530 [Candidatus Moduliflexus flocculans]|nr:hypothetical protein [Candidatus Moduliflexus flocculans]